jgi:hypothetical protein
MLLPFGDVLSAVQPRKLSQDGEDIPVTPHCSIRFQPPEAYIHKSEAFVAGEGYHVVITTTVKRIEGLKAGGGLYWRKLEGEAQ